MKHGEIMEAAIEEFEKNNPKPIHSSDKLEWLLKQREFMLGVIFALKKVEQ